MTLNRGMSAHSRAAITSLIGRKVADVRVRQVISPDALEELASLASGRLKLIETGLLRPEPEELIRISNALNVTVIDLLPSDRELVGIAAGDC